MIGARMKRFGSVRIFAFYLLLAIPGAALAQMLSPNEMD